MSVSVVKDAEGFWVDGVFVGKRIAPGLFAEMVASHRYMIRCCTGSTSAKRVGEVFGAGPFQACRVRGEHVGNARSLVEAARLLARSDDEYMRSMRLKSRLWH